MANTPKELERARKKRDAERARRNAALGVQNDGWHFEHGVWYDRNQGDKIVGYAQSEDSEITPRPNMPVPNARRDQPKRRINDPRSDFGGAPQPQESDIPLDAAAKSNSDGQFTGEDLAAAVELAPDLTKLSGGTAINDVEMENILATRISGKQEPHWTVSKTDDWDRARDLAEVIIDALPPELHNAEVAAALDFRPYLQELDGKKIVFRSDVAGPLPDITKVKTASAGKFLIAENERLAGDAIVAGGGTTAPAPTGFETGTAGVTPGAPTSGITLDANGNPVLPTGAPQNAVTFPIDGLRAAVQSGTMDLEQLAVTESNYQLDNPDSRQFFPVDVGKPTTPMPGVPAASTDTISALDALKYLYDLTPAEVHNMQLKMAAAGYFDKLNNGGAYIDGDATDSNTQAAWNLLLKDSIVTKRSVPAVLGGGLRNYREQTRKSRLAQLQDIDPTYSMSVANDYAQSVIGHDLTPAELASLDNHLHALVSQRAGFVAGAADNNTRAGALANTPTGTTDKDIQGGLDSNPAFKGEQRHANDLSLEYKLRQLMH